MENKPMTKRLLVKMFELDDVPHRLLRSINCVLHYAVTHPTRTLGSEVSQAAQALPGVTYEMQPPSTNRDGVLADGEGYYTLRRHQIWVCAQFAHEVNRHYCQRLGDYSQVPWDAAPDWQRTSAMNGVDGVLKGNTPEQSHESWLAEKEATGWKYGPVKDPDKKEHPCFVPYDQLPPEQKTKDELFVRTVSILSVALGMSA